jgi:hypothetical protein
MIEYAWEGDILVFYMPDGNLALTPHEVQICRKRGGRYPPRTPLQRRLAAQLSDDAFHQAPQAVRLTCGNDIGCESEAEHEVDHSTKEGDVTSLVIELPNVQLVINPPMAHLLAEVLADQLTTAGRLVDVDDLMLPVARVQLIALQVKGQWADVKAWQEAGTPRYEKARLEGALESCPSAPVSTEGECPCQQTDGAPAAAIFNHDDVPAFLRDQPSWWKHGVHGFRPALDDPAAPALWTFSRPAKAAFESWQRAGGKAR